MFRLVKVFLLIGLSFELLSSQEVIKLDYKKAVLYALEKNREIQRIKQEILSLEDIYRSEKWERFSPKLSAYADKEGIGLFGEVLLLDFGNRLARIRSAEISVEIKRELLREFERRVKIRLMELFRDLALAEKLAEVSREEMAVAYVRYDRERERLERGLSDRVKVAKWYDTYRKFRKRLMEAQRWYNDTLLEIKRFTGIPVDVPVEVDYHSLLEIEVYEDFTVDPHFIISRLHNNYLIRTKELEIAYFESRAKEEKRIFYPELYAYFDVKNTYSEPERFQTDANIVLNLPLFDGRASFYRFKSFKDLQRAVEIEKKDIHQKLMRFALRAPYRYEELISDYQSAVAFDDWAQENLDLSRSNYELELAFDLGYAMSTKTESERQIMRAKFEIILFFMRVYNLMGMDPMNALAKEHPFLTEKVGEI
jgi:outer membrane protein TolC